MRHRNAAPVVGRFLVLASSNALVIIRPAMSQTIGYIALIVRDYDEAIAFYKEKLGFTLVEDRPIANKRWVLVAPRGRNSPCLLLARAVTPEQKSRIGNQTGGRVFLFLYTDNFEETYNLFEKNGIEFVQKPRDEDYGRVVVFKDLYGNKWDLIEKKKG